jgi:hypothetical protein
LAAANRRNVLSRAQQMRELVARGSMLDIADKYDRLALRAELRRLKTAA